MSSYRRKPEITTASKDFLVERDGFEPSGWISIPRSRHGSRAWYRQMRIADRAGDANPRQCRGIVGDRKITTAFKDFVVVHAVPANRSAGEDFPGNRERTGNFHRKRPESPHL
jgi:hypothetical protein